MQVNGFTLSVDGRADVERSSKQEYQCPLQNGPYVLQFFLNVESQLFKFSPTCNKYKLRK